MKNQRFNVVAGLVLIIIGIFLDNIQKYKDNCKMSVMDSLENIGTVIWIAQYCGRCYSTQKTYPFGFCKKCWIKAGKPKRMDGTSEPMEYDDKWFLKVWVGENSKDVF